MLRYARRRLQGSLLTAVISVVLAGVLGTIIYFAVTSLPYLVTSPTTDPNFGALNECLLRLVPAGRVGFAVSRDATRAAAFTNDTVASCAAEGTTATSERTWKVSGATLAAFDGQSRLWVASRAGDGGGSRLLLLDGPTPKVMGDVSPQLLAGTPGGVVALEPSGRLVLVKEDGQVAALVDLQAIRDAQLTVSGDGLRVALVTAGGFLIFDAATLARLRAEAPCQVEFLWWLLDGHRAVVSCGPKASWALVLNTDTGEHETAKADERIHSVLAGPRGPWVQSCDVLPCTAVDP